MGFPLLQFRFSHFLPAVILLPLFFFNISNPPSIRLGVQYLAPPTRIPDDSLSAAKMLKGNYDKYRDRHFRVTEAAKVRFEKRLWKSSFDYSVIRARLFNRYVEISLNGLKKQYGARLDESGFWVELKKNFNWLVIDGYDADLAFTFFYAVRRKYFEKKLTRFRFADEAFIVERKKRPKGYVYSVVAKKEEESVAEVIQRMLLLKKFDVPFQNLERSVELVAERVRQYLIEETGSPYFQSIRVMDPVFYRNKAAYIISKVIVGKNITMPLVLHLENNEQGIIVSAVIMKRKEVRNFFGYSVSSFHVAYRWHRELIDFLQNMFHKMDRAAMYKAIGYDQHAQTVLFKEINEHMDTSGEKFVYPAGYVDGTTMMAFTSPDLRYVFKVIKDEDVISQKSKVRSKNAVIDKYRLVYEQDRVGRMLVSIEFTNWRMKKSFFSETVWRDLTQNASDNIWIEGDEVVLRHFFLQRQVTPLGEYLRQSPAEEDRRVLIDWGFCIRDMATSGLFNSDMIIANYGVTTAGKVVCYDFDGVSTIDRFIFKPRPRRSRPLDHDDPWDDYLYMMEGGEDDPAPYAEDDGAIWPDDPNEFLVIPFGHAKAFNAVHGEIRTVEYWKKRQQRYQQGGFSSFYPFPRSRLLSNDRDDFRRTHLYRQFGILFVNAQVGASL